MARSTAQRVVVDKEHNGRTKEFLTLVGDVARREGWHEYEVFTKWLEAAASALRNPVLKAIGDQKRWDQNEARYMEVVRSCRHPSETMRDLSNMLGIITMALAECPKDFIGPIFMEVAANSQAGQFFTPTSISEMLARMTLENARETLYRAYYEQGRTRLELMEPTCGVGGMVLAANQVLREKGFDLAEEVHWTCVDIDWRALCGAFIQLELTGVPATMVYGNALTLEEWASWPTSTLVLQHCNSLHQGGLSLPSAHVQGGKQHETRGVLSPVAGPVDMSARVSEHIRVLVRGNLDG